MKKPELFFTRVRCNHRSKPGARACDARRTLSMPLGHYYRLPACRVCGARKYREDRWRTLNEVGLAAPKPCNCGLFYSFPHHKGRGMCEHNKAITEKDFEDAVAQARSRKNR